MRSVSGRIADRQVRLDWIGGIGTTLGVEPSHQRPDEPRPIEKLADQLRVDVDQLATLKTALSIQNQSQDQRNILGVR